ncbi:ATP-binding protein [Streptomyces sp. NPDC097704]|uniref:ATP-binding protein n=1 Tax=Streptomyces sp. NPDC097704 TaxID=3157101 RepID=UPI003324C4D9
MSEIIASPVASGIPARIDPLSASNISPARVRQRRALLVASSDIRHLPAMRRFAVGTLTLWGLPAEFTSDAELIVGELAANSALHGRSDLTLLLVVEAGAVHITVTDSGMRARVPARRPCADPEERGRGLEIVKALSRRVRVVRGRSYHQVRAEMDLPGSESDSYAMPVAS